MQVRFAQTLSQLRHEKGVSQRQAAQALEVSQALLSHYENGIREPRQFRQRPLLHSYHAILVR